LQDIFLSFLFVHIVFLSGVLESNSFFSPNFKVSIAIHVIVVNIKFV